MLFFDEFGTQRGMTRHYGRAKGGQRAYGKAPDNPGTSVTLVMGLRLGGIVAPFAFEGAMDGTTWNQYIDKQVVPILRKGDIVVVDRLGAHRTVESRRAVRARGALYWMLPGYSPEFNPVKHAGSKVKQSLRGEQAQDLEGLYQAMGRAIGKVTPSDARGWFRHAGYLPKLGHSKRQRKKHAPAERPTKGDLPQAGARAPPV